jgi:hypothetical protein
MPIAHIGLMEQDAPTARRLAVTMATVAAVVAAVIALRSG